jgi:hypothetical protein
MSYLYDTDILLWSKQQADLLRRRAAGEAVNNAALDWPNIIEEIEDAGRNKGNEIGSDLVQALLRMSLYETNPLAWSEQQVGLLRRMVAGERVNDQIDWPNIIEEIESVGRSELRAITSALRIAIQHKLLLLGWPNALRVLDWEATARNQLAETHEVFRESMRKEINLQSLYRRAILATHQQMVDEGPPATVLPDQCPFSLDELLAEGAAIRSR